MIHLRKEPRTGTMVPPAQKGVVVGVDGEGTGTRTRPWTGKGPDRSRQVTAHASLAGPARSRSCGTSKTPSKINQNKNHFLLLQQKNYPANLLLPQNFTDIPNIRCNPIVGIFS